MTNLPKKITFAYDYIIKKTTTKPNAPNQKRDHFRQKSAASSCPGGTPLHGGALPWGGRPSTEHWGLAMGLQHVSVTFCSPSAVPWAHQSKEGMYLLKLLLYDLVVKSKQMLPSSRTSTPHKMHCCAHTLLMLPGIPTHHPKGNSQPVWGTG